MSTVQRKMNTDTSSENDKSLLPEIAKILNQSVSSLERYPTDIQRALCDIYIDNYHSDDITIKQALGQVVQLNSETEKQIEQAKKETPAKQERENKTNTAQSFLSRDLIMENARIISEKYQNTTNQPRNRDYEQIRRRFGGS